MKMFEFNFLRDTWSHTFGMPNEQWLQFYKSRAVVKDAPRLIRSSGFRDICIDILLGSMEQGIGLYSCGMSPVIVRGAWAINGGVATQWLAGEHPIGKAMKV